jgi:cytosine/adenosine deaminase-related metal-dependent hydrolase
MPQFTADWIYSPEAMLKDHLLEVSPEGKILALRPIRPGDQPQRFAGTLSPGFVNAHCHLELSVLQGQIPEHTGMVDFIGQVVGKRDGFSEAKQESAAKKALADMVAAGIVAVGDISNRSLTAELKRQEPHVWTHTFVELLGLVPEKAEAIVQTGRELLAAFEGLPASLSPHAPYSMSGELLAALYAQQPERMSIHLLESKAERALFDQQRGPFLGFFTRLRLPQPPFPALGAVGHVLHRYRSSPSYLLVHLTEARPDELALLQEKIPQAWFCLCPLSNLYIHQRFPEIENFLPYRDRVCLGTDSLASNQQLDIWAEVKAIHTRYPDLDWHTLLNWATYNGARALGLEEWVGAFRPGSMPGVLRLPIGPQEGKNREGEEMELLFKAKRR